MQFRKLKSNSYTQHQQSAAEFWIFKILFFLDSLINVYISGDLHTAQYVELSPPVFLLLPVYHPPPPVRMPEGRRLQRRTKKCSTFPSLTKKWEIFQNFFGNSGKNVRQRSSLGKLTIDMPISSDIILLKIMNGGGQK